MDISLFKTTMSSLTRHARTKTSGLLCLGILVAWRDVAGNRNIEVQRNKPMFSLSYVGRKEVGKVVGSNYLIVKRSIRSIAV
jgi:hypothetical protein